MLKKLCLIALSSLLVLPALSSAQDYTITSDGSSYTPTTFSTDGGTVSLKSYVCAPGNDCNIYIKSGSSAFCRVDYESGISDIDTNTCDNKVINPGTYEIFHMSSMDYFDSITFSIVGEDSGAGGGDTPVDPENPEIPLDVVGSFKTTLDGLVSDLVIGFYNYFPLVIVMGIGVLMIFTLRGYIRHASSEIFTLNKNSKKSLGWFQKEDLVNMYSNWKKDRVDKHDVNKIIENDYDYDDVSRRAEFYADNELRNNDGFYSMSSDERMEVWGKYKMDYINKHFKEK